MGKTVEIYGVEFDVKFYYQPETPADANHPGDSAELELEEVYHGTDDLIDFLSEDIKLKIEQEILIR